MSKLNLFTIILSTGCIVTSDWGPSQSSARVSCSVHIAFEEGITKRQYLELQEQFQTFCTAFDLATYFNNVKTANELIRI